MALPIDKLETLAIQQEIAQIGTRLIEPKVHNVLILCTHNSARSVLAECMLNHLAERLHINVRAYSAGSAPSGQVNPMALRVLSEAGVDVSGVRSKSWDEFTQPDAPHMRIVITVCDQAAAETCPFWPGAPVQVHWGYSDPSRVEGSEEDRQRAFELTRQALAYKITQLLFMPLDVMNDQELRQLLETVAES
ncbi:MAG: arsenate reductase ArsC [Pseudomonadota bacterium]|nr:arsenate reductase ArsC [Pseudomonadota bacterium]